ALGGEDRRDTEAIEAQRRGAAEGLGPVDRRAALPELEITKTGRLAPSRIPHRGHRLRGRHAPAHGNGTDGEAEGCTGSTANRPTGKLAMTASGVDTVAKLAADINGRRTAVNGHAVSGDLTSLRKPGARRRTPAITSCRRRDGCYISMTPGSIIPGRSAGNRTTLPNWARRRSS